MLWLSPFRLVAEILAMIASLQHTIVIFSQVQIRSILQSAEFDSSDHWGGVTWRQCLDLESWHKEDIFFLFSIGKWWSLDFQYDHLIIKGQFWSFKSFQGFSETSDQSYMYPCNILGFPAFFWVLYKFYTNFLSLRVWNVIYGIIHA